RMAACAHVKDTDTLLGVSRCDTDEQVKIAAARQYARTLPDSENTRALLKKHADSQTDRHLSILITALHANADIRQLGLSLFSNDEDYKAIAMETRFHDTRDEVTDKISSLDVVDAVWRTIKTKDKVVARKLKQRLQEHHSNTALIEEQTAEKDKIIDEMDRLANGAWSPNYTTRFDLFVQRWQALDFAISSADQQRFESLRAIASEKVEKNRLQQQLLDKLQTDTKQLKQLTARINQTELNALPATLTEAQSTLSAIASEHTQLKQVSVDTSLLQQLTDSLNRAQITLRHAKDASDAYAQITSGGNIDFDQLTSHRKVLKKTINVHAANQTPPVYVKEFPALQQSIERNLKALTQSNAELKASINKQFGSLNSAIAAGKWGPAKSMYERLERKIEKLPASDAKVLNEKLSGFEKRLNELGDWKQFATEPKLQALCEEMEKLPSHQLSPKDQADRIKDLQSQWKGMGASPGQERHWPRFKAAADIAYAPCAEYFAQRKAEKEAKLAQRQTILYMLEQYAEQVDWENPDWRLVEKTIRTAKNEWRKLRVYDRKATAAQEQAFTEALATLNSKLAPVYEQGKQEKQSLIDRVVALGEGEVNQHCINQLKTIQSQWRRTGIVERADDQRLWKAFNQAGSAIYDVHRGKQKEQYAASVEHVKRAREIIKTLRDAGTNNNALDEKNVKQLQDEFQSLPEFPERDQKFLFRDFNRAIDGLDKQREQNSESALKQQLQRLRCNAVLCDQLEALAGEPVDKVKTRMEQLLSEWNDGQKTDNVEWKKAIVLRRDSIVAHLQAGTLPDFEANTMARRLLCIDLEILLDKETPQEDKTLRMQHQLDLLQQGLTSASVESPQQQRQALEVKWLTAFPASVELRSKLESRFATALS
ncbi:MAG: DUF349 domain-containing protein, partial [Pseudomonadota bacterium]